MIGAKSGEETAAVQTGSTNITSVARSKQAIYSSKPIITFCDISIKPSGTAKYEHSLTIPEHFPPSFKGIHFSLAFNQKKLGF